MNKSKSWIKSLLIVVLAVLMICSLVACNDKGDGLEPIPTDLTAGEFFGTLWNYSSAIGSTKIEETDSVAIELGATVAINTITVADHNSIQQIDLGIDLQAVIGRTKETAKTDTALKIRLYDPTNSVSGEILTAYLFAKELDNFYIEFAGKNIKVPNKVAETIWDTLKTTSDDSSLADNIYSGLTNKFIGEEGAKQSVNDIIQAFVGKFGPTWNLNTLLNQVIKLAGLDLNEFFKKDPSGQYENSIAALLLPALGIESLEDVKDANGDIDLMKVLRSNVMEAVFNVEASRAENGGILYNASVTDFVYSLLGVAGISDLFYLQKINGVIPPYNDIALRFTAKNKKLTDFSVFAMLGGMQRMMQYNGKFISVIPTVEVKINKLSVHKATGDEIKLNGTYSEDIALNEKLTIDLTGISYKDTNLNNAKIEVGIVGKLDIVNVENNQTKVNVYVDSTVGAQKTRVISASFNDGKITAVFDKAYEFNGKEYKGVMVDVSNKFNMAEFVHDSIVKALTKGKTASVAADQAEQQPAKPTVIQIVVGCVKAALPMIQTNNNLTVSTSNIISTVAQFYNIVKGYDTTDANAWTPENRIEAITNTLKNPVLADKSIMDCVKIILGEFNIDLDSIAAPAADANAEKKPNWNKIGDAAIQILYTVAQDITIEGVATTGDVYKNMIEAVLKANIVFVGDLQNGVNASITARFADASIKITESLNVISTAEGGYTFFDEYGKYEAEEDKTQWYVNILAA